MVAFDAVHCTGKTKAGALAMAIALARPIPDPAPVTKAVFPVISMFFPGLENYSCTPSFNNMQTAIAPNL